MKASLEQVVERHEHHTWHGPAGEPAAPVGSDADGPHPEADPPRATWVMPDGTEVAYYPGDFAGVWIASEPKQVENTVWRWTVEDEEAAYVQVGAEATEEAAAAAARAWALGRAAEKAARTSTTEAKSIDLGL